MKKSILNSFVTAAAFSLTVGISSHAAGETIQGQSVTNGVSELSHEQVQFGAIRSLDAAKIESLIFSKVMDDIEQQDVKVTSQAQRRAEALYQGHRASGSTPALQAGSEYQVVAISR
jgi:phage portal protein BeeE